MRIAGVACHHHAAAAVAAFASLLFVGSAIAQVEEIIVTARKKEENLQDVPFTVTAFGREAIERKGINRIGDIAKLTPSVQFDESFAQSDTRVVVRGLSPTRGRQNVAFLVDGIDLSSEAITSSGGSLLVNTRLLDVERIEVLKGPKVALYGRAAFNGVISYTTKAPSTEFEADIKVDINDEEQYSLTGSVSGPVFGDKLGVRVNAAWWDESGFYNNAITGGPVADEKGYGLSISTRSAFDNGLTINFRAEFTADEGKPSAQVYLPFNSLLRVPVSAQDGPGGVGIATCNTALINVISEPTQPLGDPVGLGNDARLIERARRIINPALAGALGFPGSLDPNLPADQATGRSFVQANSYLSPYCEDAVFSYTGALPDRKDIEREVQRRVSAISNRQGEVSQATDPTRPGQDYAGFDRDLWRVALTGDWQFDKGKFSFWAGYLKDENTESQDTNAFGIPANNIFLDGNVNSFSFDNDKETEQFSLQLRWATDFEGPINAAIGGNYWKEEVDNRSSSIPGQGSGSHCFWNSGSGFISLPPPTGCYGYTETVLAPYQNAAAPFRPPNPADRDTDHYSIYGMLDFQLTPALTLELEGRYNVEEVEVFGPIFFDPGAGGGPGSVAPCGIFFRPCEDFNTWLGSPGNPGNWFADLFFPWDAAGNLDQTILDAIPDKCWEQDSAKIWRSILDSPAQVERNPDGTPVVGLNGSTPVPIPVVDPATGRVLQNPEGTDMFNAWCVDKLSDKDSWFVPKITLRWQAADNAMVYGYWARTQKPGGFSLLTVGASGLDRERTVFKPEKMTVYEAGAKTDWFQRTVQINGAVFFQDFTDKQALTSVQGNQGRLVSKIVNAGSAEVWGAELAVVWSPASSFIGGNWTVSGGYTWLDTEYTDFRINSGSPVTVANAGNCTPVSSVPGGPVDICEVSYSGNELESSPPGAFAGSLRYGRQLTGELDFYVETDVQWTDKRFTDITNQSFTKAFWNTDLRIGLQSANWEILAYVNNLFDDDTVRFAGGGPGLGCCFVLGSEIDTATTTNVVADLPLYKSAFLPPPRVIGVRASYRFGAQ
ncbi:MAG: TonB-dependent receptor [Gammaproteobacteria bacterium]|nr:TonB-dependent receptor [Gammaproteobacteria bacterium]